MAIGHCNTLTGRHKFEPRYDEVPHDHAKNLIAKNYTNINRSDSIRRVYLHDICIFCGEIVDRLEPHKEEIK